MVNARYKQTEEKQTLNRYAMDVLGRRVCAMTMDEQQSQQSINRIAEHIVLIVLWLLAISYAIDIGTGFTVPRLAICPLLGSRLIVFEVTFMPMKAYTTDISTYGDFFHSVEAHIRMTQFYAILMTCLQVPGTLKQSDIGAEFQKACHGQWNRVKNIVLENMQVPDRVPQLKRHR